MGTTQKNKNKKDIHIVFGESNAGTIRMSEIVDLKSIQFICFQDYLTIGPICGVNSVEEIEKRDEWFSKVFELGWYSADEDIKKIKTLIENYNNENIYLWTGFRTCEILNTARLLSHLFVPCNNIFLIDFSKVPPKKYENGMYYPDALGVLCFSEVKKLSLSKHFNQLTEEKLSYFVQQWEKVKLGNSILRILDENGQVSEVEETYFDSLLISCCTNEYKGAARIIGEVLGRHINSHNEIDDAYLNWRLKELALTKKVKKRGELKEIRDYELKLNE